MWFAGMTFVSSIYFLIDAERPFTGLVRVDLSIFKNMLDEINNLIVKLDEALDKVGFALYSNMSQTTPIHNQICCSIHCSAQY